ncbi:phosphoenolpyruvate carboxylase [Burkholderia pyrrocinia]|uniref:phosphoenolpyruvate carboxylase n=1 Tax=Burkholderia pyrrocinia TaxID=60550 RepID=UPI0038B5B6D4
MKPRGEACESVAVTALANRLLALTAATRERSEGDPFANPVLSLACAIMQSIGDGRIGGGDPLELVRQLRDQAFSDRAARIAAYVGGVGVDANEAALESIADRVVGDANDWDGFRARAERTRYAAVFTGHPTFALNPEVARHLADRACGAAPRRFESHRPGTVTLDAEFEQSVQAIDHARDALDRFNAALLSAARRAFPDRWLALVPRPLIASTWVGYDTDGRTDIGWSDTLRFRLRIKRLQLARIHRQASAVSSARELAERVAKALDVLDRQIAVCPDGADARQTSRFAQALVAHRDDALVDPETLDTLYRDAIAAAPDRDKLALAVSRAGLASHGLALAHTHFRLNAAQLHNAARQRLNIADSVDAPLHRRAMLAAINAELDKVQPLPVDFGALLAEQATAARTMMTIAQLVKHIDGATPVRFLIAETESGYTLLVALWLARLFGVERHVEISPLFETEEALEHGAHVLDEALRSPHYRAYVKSHGRLALQFGYSDSGRYVGQLAASYLIERLRMKIAGMLARHGLDGVEVVLFDTHGESVGRGAHPGSLADRLKYLSPTASRHALNDWGLQVREESAFQGGDGYLLFGTPALALATVARIAEHAFHHAVGPVDDPIYDDPDFAADFFGSIRATMTALVDDAGYTAMLSAFGPALLDRTGSRPAARQADGAAFRALIRHPSELRAIPNNAILQQLGWCANTVHGLGAAAARQPEGFAEMRGRSRRFRRALDLAEAAFAHSDIEVLRAVTSLLDPGTWLDRALHTADGGARDAMLAVAAMLERIDASAATRAMFRRALADDLALRTVWPNRARMSDREILLHALRLALIQLVWLKATEIPEFSPRPDVTVDDLHRAIVGLDMPSVLPVLVRIFPERTDDTAEYEYAEPAAPRAPGSYAREHREIFAPMRQWFESIREISVAVTHEVGTFG